MSELFLAFDTSGPIGSAALGRDGIILGSRFLVNQSSHASSLIPAVSSLLDELGFAPADLTGLVVGDGPGSFTGVRVAAATAKGLAATLGLPVWAVSSLLAGAASGGVDLPAEVRAVEVPGDSPPSPGRPPEGAPFGFQETVAVVFDARGDRVYAAAYQGSPEGLVERIPPVATTLPALLVNPELPGNAVCCGDGAVKHGSILREAGFTVVPPPMGLPTAEGLLRIHRLRATAPPLDDVSSWEPTYLRGSSAKPLPGA